MTDSYSPSKSDKFSFGLWTVGNTGRDPFGDPVRSPLNPVHTVTKLAELGAWGISLHDNDLVPFGTPARERDAIVRQFQNALEDHGMIVPMATTNLFTHPVFRDGAFTSSDRQVRAFALQKTMSAIDLGAELGANICLLGWTRRGRDRGLQRCDRGSQVVSGGDQLYE